MEIDGQFVVTEIPTGEPSSNPTFSPSMSPSLEPTRNPPTLDPTLHPTAKPTFGISEYLDLSSATAGLLKMYYGFQAPNLIDGNTATTTNLCAGSWSGNSGHVGVPGWIGVTLPKPATVNGMRLTACHPVETTYGCGGSQLCQIKVDGKLCVDNIDLTRNAQEYFACTSPITGSIVEISHMNDGFALMMAEMEIDGQFVVTESPTGAPSSSPTFSPSLSPSLEPTRNPPTLDPTFHPTVEPTVVVTESPTGVPSSCPTFAPSMLPTFNPTTFPSTTPTSNPSLQPTHSPTLRPTANPTL